MWVIRADHLRPGMVLFGHGEVLSVGDLYRMPGYGRYVDVTTEDGETFSFLWLAVVGVLSLGPHQREAYLMRREGVLEDAPWDYRSRRGYVYCARGGALYTAWASELDVMEGWVGC